MLWHLLVSNWMTQNSCYNCKQDGQLALAFFSPNYNFFDQALQTVEIDTTVLTLVFKDFLQTSIRPLISVLNAKGYHDFPLKNFWLTVPKYFVEERFCVVENFWFRKMLGMREGAGLTIFPQNCFCLTGPNHFVEEPFCVSRNFQVSKILCVRGKYHDFP